MSFASFEPLLAQATLYLELAAPYAAAGALVLAFIAVCLQLALRRRLKRLALGRNGSIEESVSILSRDMKDTKEFRAELEKYLKLAETRLRRAVQGVGLVRFNPFSGDGSGGNQSFAMALLDDQGDGVVLSALYARDRVGVYAKPLQKGVSSYELSEEEKSAVEVAQKSVADTKKRAGV